MKNFTICEDDRGIISITVPMSNVILYKVPYEIIKTEKIETPNRFINYILTSETKKKIYVGKTKNGIYDNKKRPSEHENKCEDWTDCIIITMKTDEFLNDGVIQYIENELNTKFSDLKYYKNTTCQTTKQTANSKEQRDCEIYLKEIFRYLKILYPTLTIFLTEKEKAVLSEETEKNKKIKTKNLFFKEIKKEIKKVNNNFKFIPMKDYVNVNLDGKNFATIYKLSNGFNIYFRAKDEDFENNENLLSYVPSTAHRIGNWKLQVLSKKDFQALKDYLNQTINL